MEAPAHFVIAPRVAGRVVELALDLADPVEKGRLVARLDDAEFVQDVKLAAADLEVARANQIEAQKYLEIARREHERVLALHEKGVATDARVDEAKSDLLAREAAIEVTAARVVRAEAALAAARVRLSYTEVPADWPGEGTRYVAERHVDEGATVAAGAPLLTITTLDPLIAVVYVTEKDYGRLKKGQVANLRTDSHPGQVFRGAVSRVAPVFDRESRQARMEIQVPNADMMIKPGMFVSVEIVLEEVKDAITIPHAALVTRDGGQGVFLLDDAGDKVRWQPVETGFRQDDRVLIRGELSGEVVTLGQQLIGDGSAVRVVDEIAGRRGAE